MRCRSLMMPGFVDCHTHVVSYLLAGLRSKFDSVQSGVGNGLNERRIRTLNVIANDKSAAALFTTYVVRFSHTVIIIIINRGPIKSECHDNIIV